MSDRILARYILVFIVGLAACAIAGSAVYELVIILAIAFFLKLLRDANPERLMITAVLFTVGMIVFSAAEAKTNAVAEKFDGSYVELYATVLEPPKLKNDNYIMKVSGQKIRYASAEYKTDGYVQVYCGDRINFRAGDDVRISGKYVRPQENKNSGGFNLRTYLKTDDIRATMFVSANSIRLAGHSHSWQSFIFEIKQKINNRISSHIGGEQGELVKAVVTGDKESFTDEMKNNFADCGISHIVAISGMHMSILIMFIMRLGRFFGIRRKLRSLCAIVVILCYISILGFVPSAIRAAVMGIAVMSAELINRREDFITSILIGAALILLINPYWVFDTGFLLSFSAVIGIHLFAPALSRMLSRMLPNPIRSVLAMSIAANLLTMPIVATIFNKINLVGFAANIIIVPVLEILFIGGICAAILPVYIITLPLKTVATLVLAIADFMAELRFMNISVMTPNILMLMINAMFIFIVYHILNRRNLKIISRGVAVLAVLIGICAAQQIYKQDLLRVEFINTGQGDSILISSDNKHFMIDTGRENSRDSLEYIKDRGIKKLDILFITHSDSDHSGGAMCLAENIRIEKAVLPYVKTSDETTRALEAEFIKRGTDVMYAEAGDSFTLGDATAKVLMPDGNEIEEDYRNNNSLVMKIEYKENEFLMMADAGFDTEKVMMEKYELSAKVLKAGHHGSAKSTSEEFLNLVKPEYAILSCGVNNYGHPSEEVLEKLENCGCVIYRTDESGNIVFEINKKGKMTVVK